MAEDTDWGQAEKDLKEKSGQWYEDSMLDDLKRNTSNNGGGDVGEWSDRIASKAQLRANNEVNSRYEEDGHGGNMVKDHEIQTFGGGANYGGYASGSGNSGLDGLMSQMIANQKAQAERDAGRAAEQDKFRADTRANIMDRFAKASAPVDMNNPILAKAAQVHDAASQRALSAGREAMAARGAVSRTGAGANDAMLSGAYENLGKDNANFQSNLMIGENDKNRSEISDMLHLGTGILTADEDRNLREKMGTIGAANDQMRIGNESRDIDNRFSLGNRGLDMQKYGIDTNDRQFYDKMGNDNGLQAALMNQYLMSQLGG